MKIRHRLPLIFTLSTSMVLLGMSLFVYYFSSNFRQKEFTRHLQERVDITEKLFLESENMKAEVYKDIREKFLRVLPDETEEVGLAEAAEFEKLRQKYPPAFVEQLQETGYAEFEKKRRQGVGRVYEAVGGNYWVIVTAIDQDGIRKMAHLRRILIFSGILGVALIFLIAWLEGRQILKSISDTIAKARSVSASNLHLRLKVYDKKNEIGELAITFNNMLDRLQSAFDMQRSFISNASHEIKNPLTAIIGEAELALEKMRSGEEYKQSLQTILEEAERLDMLVINLLSLAKTGFDDSQILRADFRLDELLLDIVSDLHTRIPKRKIKIDFSQAPENSDHLQLHGNPNLLRIAFLNLLENACKFSEYKEVLLSLKEVEGSLQVWISDQGVGIPSRELPRILEPFYRAHNARSFKGFGIGLPLTDKIIQMHQAELAIHSIEGKGTEVRVIFS